MLVSFIIMLMGMEKKHTIENLLSIHVTYMRISVCLFTHNSSILRCTYVYMSIYYPVMSISGHKWINEDVKSNDWNERQ